MVEEILQLDVEGVGVTLHAVEFTCVLTRNIRVDTWHHKRHVAPAMTHGPSVDSWLLKAKAGGQVGKAAGEEAFEPC